MGGQRGRVGVVHGVVWERVRSLPKNPLDPHDLMGSLGYLSPHDPGTGG